MTFKQKDYSADTETTYVSRVRGFISGFTGSLFELPDDSNVSAECDKALQKNWLVWSYILRSLETLYNLEKRFGFIPTSMMGAVPEILNDGVTDFNRIQLKNKLSANLVLHGFVIKHFQLFTELNLEDSKTYRAFLIEVLLCLQTVLYAQRSHVRRLAGPYGQPALMQPQMNFEMYRPNQGFQQHAPHFFNQPIQTPNDISTALVSYEQTAQLLERATEKLVFDSDAL